MSDQKAEFPFDSWDKLAAADPTAFEAARKMMLDSRLECL
ncbi:MAG: DUF3135 domain-containing protein [Gammaproteobacteria bacterium]|nr:DUF3135 domain-containing protein [Gammaproteobacteria bacterium]